MKKLLKEEAFTFTINKAFAGVIDGCQKIIRSEQAGTWINDDVKDAFIKLYEAGFAHSAEVWLDEHLVGGLYGIRLGKVFFGESMFSRVSNASKYAFIKYIDQLKKEDVQLIDCQVYTEHLESLGAGMISRKEFTLLLKQLIP